LLRVSRVRINIVLVPSSYPALPCAGSLKVD